MGPLQTHTRRTPERHETHRKVPKLPLNFSENSRSNGDFSFLDCPVLGLRKRSPAPDIEHVFRTALKWINSQNPTEGRKICVRAFTSLSFKSSQPVVVSNQIERSGNSAQALNH